MSREKNKKGIYTTAVTRRVGKHSWLDFDHHPDVVRATHGKHVEIY